MDYFTGAVASGELWSNTRATMIAMLIAWVFASAGGFWMTTRAALSDSPVTIGRFCQAIRNATAFIADPAHRDAVVADLAELTGLPSDRAQTLYDAEHLLWSNDLDPSRWESNAEWVLGPDSMKAPFDTAVDNSCS